MSKAQKTTFQVANREIEGSGVAQLRRENTLPANVYGLNQDSQSVQVDRNTFDKLYSEEGDTGLIYLQIGDSKKQTPVLIDEVQTHPVTGLTIHAAFKRVDLTEKVSAEVPVEIIGEVDIPGATMLTVADSIEVEALPADLPDKFEVDVSQLTEIGQSITYADLEYDKETVTILLGDDEDPAEMPIVLIQEVREEVEPEETEEVAEGEEAATEGEDSTDSEESGGEQSEADADSESSGE